MRAKTYYELVIEAESPGTEIWLGDDEGHFVQKEVGSLSTSLLPGLYVVEFGLGAPQYEINLAGDRHHTEKELKAGTPSARRVPELPE